MGGFDLITIGKVLQFLILEPTGQDIDLWIKILYTAFVLILIPIYWKHWGPANFLWFSDIALILCVPALWIESSLLASMMALGVLLPEVYWTIEILLRLITGKELTGLTGYMFDKKRPLFLRLLSLFHVLLPPIIILMLSHFGYDPDALFWQTGLAWIVLVICYKFTSPSKNINWAFGFGEKVQEKFHPVVWLILVMLSNLLLLFLPTHFLLKWIFTF